MITCSARNRSGILDDEDVRTCAVQVWALFEALEDMPGTLEANDALASARTMFREALVTEGVLESELRALAGLGDMETRLHGHSRCPPDDASV